MFESRGRKEDKDLELEFRRVCDGANRMNIRLPFEIILADKKANSSGLQLADLVARPIGLRILRPAPENRAFDVLTRKFFCSGGRENVGEGFEDWGFESFPQPRKRKAPVRLTEAMTPTGNPQSTYSYMPTGILLTIGSNRVRQILCESLEHSVLLEALVATPRFPEAPQCVA